MSLIRVRHNPTGLLGNLVTLHPYVSGSSEMHLIEVSQSFSIHPNNTQGISKVSPHKHPMVEQLF